MMEEIKRLQVPETSADSAGLSQESTESFQGGLPRFTSELASAEYDDPIHQKILAEAENLFSQNPNWATFYRQIVGPEGVVRKYFPSPEALAQFRRTETYLRIQRMLTQLRGSRPRARRWEPVKVITVRVPESVHDAIAEEAMQLNVSINKLCIAKLLQIIEADILEGKRQRRKTAFAAPLPSGNTQAIGADPGRDNGAPMLD